MLVNFYRNTSLPIRLGCWYVRWWVRGVLFQLSLRLTQPLIQPL